MARFRYSTGERGKNRVRAFEQARDGRLYLEWHVAGRREYVALPSNDRDAAKRKADELAARLRQPDERRAEPLTLATLFDIYGREKTPHKGRSQQAADRRAARNWCDILGPSRQVASLTHLDAARFVRERQRRGDSRPGGTQGGPLRARVADQEVRQLRTVIRWAIGAGFLDRNPLEGYKVEGERNPRRPMTTAPQYEKLLRHAAEVHPLLSSLLVVAHDTGHRIGAVRQLRWEDVDLRASSVRWVAGFEKTRREHRTPLTRAAVSALRQARKAAAAISDWVFPSPTDASKPVSVHLARDWWIQCEVKANVPHQPGCGWHSLRRLFATELKAAPLKDLCELGGWLTPQLVVSVYQRADPVTMRKALKQRARLEAVG